MCRMRTVIIDYNVCFVTAEIRSSWWDSSVEAPEVLEKEKSLPSIFTIRKPQINAFYVV